MTDQRRRNAPGSHSSSDSGLHSTGDLLHPPGGDASEKPPGFLSLAPLRARVLAGMVILVPLGVTLLLTYRIGEFLYRHFEKLIGSHVQQFAQQSPVLTSILTNDAFLAVAVVIVSILIIVVCLYAAGLLSAIYIVKRGISLGEMVIQRIPVVNFLYGVLKQIMDTLAIQQSAKGKTQRLVLTEYPRKGVFVLGFVTGETAIANTGQLFVNVFVPTTPNPTSGFLLLAPPDEVYDTNLSLEVGVKFLVSGGILVPENLRSQQFNPEGDGNFAPPATIEDVPERQEQMIEEALAAEAETKAAPKPGVPAPKDAPLSGKGRRRRRK